MRPVGSVIFGHLGDKIGRKQALTVSVLMMAIPTFLIGVMPGFDQIGVAAAVLMVLLRMLQGVSVGGEYTTSITFLIEHAPTGKRGLMASWRSGRDPGHFARPGGRRPGFNLPARNKSMIGRRIPFCLGILIGLSDFICAGTWSNKMRQHRAAGIAAGGKRTRPLAGNAANRRACRGGGDWLYMIFIYTATWLQQSVHIDKARTLDINTLNMALMLLFIPAWPGIGQNRA